MGFRVAAGARFFVLILRDTGRTRGATMVMVGVHLFAFYDAQEG